MILLNDTISKRAVIDTIREMSPELFSAYQHNAYIDKQGVIIRIMALPPAQAERKKGKWKVSNLPKGKMKYCSECGFGQYIADERRYNYCPNCGAEMEKEEA